MNVPGASLLRRVLSRGGASFMIFVVAVVAVAAAAAGPTYYQAAQTSILRDTLAAAPVLGRGFGITQTGSVSGTIGTLDSEADGVLSGGLGSASNHLNRLFQAPVEALESTAFDPAQQQVMPFVWRSGVCAHLVIRGRCPSQPGQVIVSQSLAAAFGVHTGQHLTVPTWGTLTITGIYAAPSGGDYWFDTLGTYFPAEFPPSGPQSNGPSAAGVDALFTTEATMEAAPSTVQGTDRIDDLLSVPNVGTGDVHAVANAVDALLNSNLLQTNQAIPASTLPTTMSSVVSAWSSLEVPVVLVSAQLLGLAWLLLLLLVTEDAEARGAEVALAKLRGQGRLRTLAFGLSQPLALLALALPVGAMAGWGTTVLLANGLLRPGTAVPFSALGWATAAAAIVGGLTAVLLASRRMLGRPVVEQWRRAGRHAAERGWVIDGILLTGAAAGLLDLLATGSVSSAHKSALALLVPGLLGLAVAVVASRLLPLVCRALTAGGRSAGGLGTFLALRHIARRPGGARTTIMLATSFALATFALAAWAVNDHNDTVLASAQVGAPEVLDVAIPQTANLGSLVDQVDPSGKEAAPVEEYFSQNTVTLAVDPSRWSRVADWPGPRPRNLPTVIDPSSPAPIILDGTAVRISLTVKNLSPPGSTLILDVDSPDATASTPVELGTPPPRGRFVATGDLVGCPCRFQDLTIQPPPAGFHGSPSAVGEVTVTGMEVGTGDVRWEPVGGIDDPSRWSTPQTPGSVQAAPNGLDWKFTPTGTGSSAILAPVDHPLTLPAIAASAVTGGHPGPQTISGLDGNQLPVDVQSVVPAIPGAPANGVVVDLTYAERAADDFVSPLAIDQVWVTAGHAGEIARNLERLGVQVMSTTSESATKSLLGRQGPGLARVLFVAEAGAAAALAAGGAILGLYLFARRRRYEYAALSVTGLRRRTLLGSLVAEQLIVVVFGLIVGIGAGLAAVAVALRAVPEFLTVPAAPALSYLPPAGELAFLLAITAGVVVAGAIAASLLMVRGVRLDQLREAPA